MSEVVRQVLWAALALLFAHNALQFLKQGYADTFWRRFTRTGTPLGFWALVVLHGGLAVANLALLLGWSAT